MKKSNGSVTDCSNGSHGGIDYFYKRALSINTEEKRPFSCADFMDMNPGNYRQYIHRLGDKIEIVRKGRPALYKVRGVKLAGDSHRVTKKGTGDTTSFEYALKSVKHQPAQFHDIKLKFSSDLHSKLVERGATVNPSNHSIKVEYPHLNNNLITKTLVYPETIQVDISNTYLPLIHDFSGFLSLFQHLSGLHQYLLSLSSFTSHVPDVKDWILTHYHLNKDSSARYSGQAFCIDLDSVGQVLSRYYSKKMPNGKTIIRYEKIITPKISLQEQITSLF